MRIMSVHINWCWGSQTVSKGKDVRERISKSTKPSGYKPVGEPRKFYVIERQTSSE